MYVESSSQQVIDSCNLVCYFYVVVWIKILCDHIQNFGLILTKKHIFWGIFTRALHFLLFFNELSLKFNIIIWKGLDFYLILKWRNSWSNFSFHCKISEIQLILINWDFLFVKPLNLILLLFREEFMNIKLLTFESFLVSHLPYWIVIIYSDMVGVQAKW